MDLRGEKKKLVLNPRSFEKQCTDQDAEIWGWGRFLPSLPSCPKVVRVGNLA